MINRRWHHKQLHSQTCIQEQVLFSTSAICNGRCSKRAGIILVITEAAMWILSPQYIPHTCARTRIHTHAHVYTHTHTLSEEFPTPIWLCHLGAHTHKDSLCSTSFSVTKSISWISSTIHHLEITPPLPWEQATICKKSDILMTTITEKFNHFKAAMTIFFRQNSQNAAFCLFNLLQPIDQYIGAEREILARKMQ